MGLREDIREILAAELQVAGESVLQYAEAYPSVWQEQEQSVFKTALRFASYAHRGVTRKGIITPYVLHPLEAALIVMTLTDKLQVITAALLHDVVEDTAFTCEDMKNLFGSAVAELVAAESEDKMKDRPAAETWRERKENSLQKLADAPKEVKLICLADKLSNIRQTVLTHAAQGDAMWQNFNQKDPEQQAWYYFSLARALKQLSDTAAYREYVERCEMVFGSMPHS